EDRHAPLLQVAHGAAPDVVLADFVDADRGHDARVQPEALEAILHGERVHHRGEHAHVVGRHAVHAGTRESRAAEDVAAADHERELDIHLTDLLQLPRDAPDDRRLDAVVPVAHQGLTRELHQDPRVAHRGSRHLTPSAPALFRSFSMETSGSLTNACPARVTSFNALRKRPSTILATISGGLPSLLACWVRMSRSLATTSAGTCVVER